MQASYPGVFDLSRRPRSQCGESGDCLETERLPDAVMAPAKPRKNTPGRARVDPLGPPAIFRPLRDIRLHGAVPDAPVAELVDALDSKSSSARSAGSIPARGTNNTSSTPSPNLRVLTRSAHAEGHADRAMMDLRLAQQTVKGIAVAATRPRIGMT